MTACERNSSINTKVSEEGEARGVPGTRVVFPLLAARKTQLKKFMECCLAWEGPHAAAGAAEFEESTF